ncbi:hypothetical protein A2115_02575 [Candidatus Woesebacteria bacterium GWA1_41_8]|uniref:Transport permease protein n=1 Tax=Candidatus Woesebacteria bacterium GWA1_41_8 TaxID=1802471 RepID=A0A1F7WJ29_9BACT|nr:MAG: hypothetical protein A2115_02575 [Candidatus Woesebacteria bacterium GWA1_41_8]
MSTKGYAKYVWLAWILTLRELKGRYKTAVLGFMWAFVNPLIQLLVLGLVFSIFLKVQVPNYPVFLLSGLLPWTFFSSALTQGTSSLINNRDIIKKTFFPRQVIPISTVAASLINFLVTLIIFLILIILISLPVSFNPLFIILALFLLITLTLGLILTTSSLEIYYRDVSFIVQALVLVWFYLTPVIYPLSFVPEKYLAIYKLNPMVGIVSLFRGGFLGTSQLSLDAVLISAAEAVSLLIFGLWIFKKRQIYFPDWV